MNGRIGALALLLISLLASASASGFLAAIIVLVLAIIMARQAADPQARVLAREIPGQPGMYRLIRPLAPMSEVADLITHSRVNGGCG